MEEVNERKWCVYMHINKTNQKVYIGLTSKDVKDRWGSTGNGYGEQQPVFKRAIDKYGWDGFEHVIVEDNLTYKEATEMEVSLIALYKSNCGSNLIAENTLFCSALSNSLTLSSSFTTRSTLLPDAETSQTKPSSSKCGHRVFA